MSTNQSNNVYAMIKLPFTKLKTKNKSNEDEQPIDIINTLKSAVKDNKEIFAALIAVIGVIITASYYVYYQGYNSYFGIDNKWNNAGDKSIYFKIILPLCLGFILLLPNLITAFPFIIKLPKLRIVWYELLVLIIPYGLLICFYSKIDTSLFIKLIIGCIAVLLFLITLILALTNCKISRIISFIVGISLIILIIGFLVYNHSKLPTFQKWFEAAFIWLVVFGLAYPIIFCLPSKTVDNKNSKVDKIKRKNTFLIVAVISLLFAFSVFEIILYSDGLSQAQIQKSFNVILLDENEYYRNLLINSTNASSRAHDETLSNLPTNEEECNEIIEGIMKWYKGKPYINIVEVTDENGEKTKVIRRIVNAYIVIASSGDDSLVFNGYIDENNNLYYFSEEQKTIKNENVIINTMEFSKVEKWDSDNSQSQ